MTRTLADMTPAERAACVGRWATYRGSTSPRPVIIWAIEDDIVWRLAFPPRHAIVGTDLDQITPRFDLLRAWTPDGQPVDTDVETGHVDWGRIWLGHEIMERTNLPDGTTVHRHVTDWEVAP